MPKIIKKTLYFLGILILAAIVVGLVFFVGAAICGWFGALGSILLKGGTEAVGFSLSQLGTMAGLGAFAGACAAIPPAIEEVNARFPSEVPPLAPHPLSVNPEQKPLQVVDCSSLPPRHRTNPLLSEEELNQFQAWLNVSNDARKAEYLTEFKKYCEFMQQTCSVTQKPYAQLTHPVTFEEKDGSVHVNEYSPTLPAETTGGKKYPGFPTWVYAFIRTVRMMLSLYPAPSVTTVSQFRQQSSDISPECGPSVDLTPDWSIHNIR